MEKREQQVRNKERMNNTNNKLKTMSKQGSYLMGF